MQTSERVLARDSHVTYRPEIDGLRAIAVSVVILFHAGFGCPGGYVGVDVFFVISGFLITSLVWSDLDRGSFSFANFWERRARRILPAFVFVTVVVLAAGWLLLLPSDLKSLGRAAASQSLFLANFYFWRESGYFASDSAEKPLLHTWSLAVEEQFYFIVPFALYLLFQMKSRSKRVVAGSLLACAATFSFALSANWVNHHQWAAFYLLPSRAWELLLGSIIAFCPAPPKLLVYRKSREIISGIGLILIGIPVALYDEVTPFPGVAAIPPCAGTALIIWANGRRDDDAPTLVAGLLSLRPVVFVGLISYSLYLWHWPVIALAKYTSFTTLSTCKRAAAAGLAIFLSVLSWKYVETPFRHRKVGASRSSMMAIAGSGLISILCCGLLCNATDGFPSRLNQRALSFDKSRSDRASQKEVTIDEIRSNKLLQLGANDGTRTSTVLVWGDSHAMCDLPAFDVLFQERGLAAEAAVRYGTPPSLDWRGSVKCNSEMLAVARAWNEAVIAHVQARRFPFVVLVGCWKGYKLEAHDPGAVDRSLLKTIHRIVEIGSRPILLLDNPVHEFNIPKVLAFSTIFGGDVDALCSRPSVENALDLFAPSVIKSFETAGARVLNPKSRFLDPTGQRYLVEMGGSTPYFDNNHLSIAGAKRVLLPFLRESLDSLLRAGRSGENRAAPYRVGSESNLRGRSPAQ
jgi:peptidoglycan/LPS O-acetylase OafA/YrhL